MLAISCSLFHSYLSLQAQPTIFPLIIFLLVNASLKYGINSSSCDAFGGYGIILCTLGKLREGTEMSKAVYLLLSKPGMCHMRSRSMFVTNCFIRKMVVFIVIEVCAYDIVLIYFYLAVSRSLDPASTKHIRFSVERVPRRSEKW